MKHSIVFKIKITHIAYIEHILRFNAHFFGRFYSTENFGRSSWQIYSLKNVFVRAPPPSIKSLAQQQPIMDAHSISGRAREYGAHWATPPTLANSRTPSKCLLSLNILSATIQSNSIISINMENMCCAFIVYGKAQLSHCFCHLKSPDNATCFIDGGPSKACRIASHTVLHTFESLSFHIWIIMIK